MNNTKIFAVAAMGLIVAGSMSSCKSNESMYKKAYEKAQQAQTTSVVEEPATVGVTPVEQATVTTTTVTATPQAQQQQPAATNVRVTSESVQVVDGAGLKAYSVIVGSFGLRANADGLQKKLKEQGYQAQIALNSERQLYRVVASTHDTREQAIASRDKLRDSFPDAWLLYKK